jgi:hypothetical protein
MIIQLRIGKNNIRRSFTIESKIVEVFNNDGIMINTYNHDQRNETEELQRILNENRDSNIELLEITGGF